MKPYFKRFILMLLLLQSYLRNSSSRTLNQEVNLWMKLTDVNYIWLQNTLSSNFIDLIKKGASFGE